MTKAAPSGAVFASGRRAPLPVLHDPPPLNFDVLASLALLSFAAAAVQSITGFGFAVIVARFQMALLGTSVGIQAVIV